MGDEAWNAFVDACLMKHCDGASVLDLRDGRVWGSSGDFGPRTYTATVTNEAGEDASERVNEADILASFGRGARHPHGLRINRQKYMVVRLGPGQEGGTVAYGKKPMGGCCVATGAQCIVVGSFDEKLGQTAGGANVAVEKLAAYLRGVGF